MSLVCLAAARLRIVSLRLAVAVAVLGGIGPFFGSYEFIREGRGRGQASGERLTRASHHPLVPEKTAILQALRGSSQNARVVSQWPLTRRPSRSWTS